VVANQHGERDSQQSITLSRQKYLKGLPEKGRDRNYRIPAFVFLGPPGREAVSSLLVEVSDEIRD
jgi:hypothetical protein